MAIKLSIEFKVIKLFKLKPQHGLKSMITLKENNSVRALGKLQESLKHHHNYTTMNQQLQSHNTLL